MAGTTETAGIEGISAAGASTDLRRHTPGADAEILVYGRPVRSPVVPVSPGGCPTPAAVTRAACGLLDLPVTVVDGGLPGRTAAPTVSVGAGPGADVRTPEPVPEAAAIYEAAREFGRCLPDDERLLLGESIPGGTTTALGVLTALGERATVSSSLVENPIQRKREVVADGIAASEGDAGGAFGEPVRALRTMGDPVLTVAAGIARGALETDTPLTLAGGTQLLAVAALLRHDGVDASLELATTSFLRADETADVDGLAGALDVALTATDPGFDTLDHPAAASYCAGEAKEGVAMGGVLAAIDDGDHAMAALREQFVTVADRLDEIHPPAASAGGEGP